MKDIFRKIASIAMAFTVILSTMSFSVDMHYCGDHLVDFSLYDKVDTCMMKAKMGKSSTDCKLSRMAMDCCSDVEIVVEGRDDLKISFDQLNFEQQLFLVTFAYSYINLFQGLEENSIPFIDYSPPPLIRDIQILDQTFLI